MEPGLGNSCTEVLRSIKYPESAIRKPAPARVQVGEGRHDNAGPGPTDAILQGNEPNIASFVAKSRIGETLQFEDRFKVTGVGDPFK